MSEDPRGKPRISLNKFAEYLNTNPSRRRRILYEQKLPRDFQVIYYQPAQKAISRFICDGCDDEDPLISEIDDLYAKDAKNEYEEHRWPNNAKAIESFLDFYEEIEIGDLAATHTSTKAPKLAIEGVDVSVFPEITLTGEDRQGNEVISGIALMFTKDVEVQLTKDIARYPASLVREYFTRHDGGRTVRPRDCFIVDVFGQGCFQSPTHYKKAMRDINAACREIRLLWDDIEMS